MTGGDRIKSTPDRASASLSSQYSASELIKAVREFPKVVCEFSRVALGFPGVVRGFSRVDRELSEVETWTPKRGILVSHQSLKHLDLARIGITIKHDDKGAVGDESPQNA